jgi:vacuolar-type H+-ATPase subunit E/Vma4
MNPVDPTLPSLALAPLRIELLRRARADADRTRRDAEATAAEILAAAEIRCDEIVGEAIARGEADAAEIRTTRRAKVRHGLRADELAAQRMIYEDLAAKVTDAVCGLRDDADYPRVRQRLTERTRELLGPAAVIAEAPGGGIVARGPGRRLDYSLSGFAARAVERLGADIAGLWQP